MKMLRTWGSWVVRVFLLVGGAGAGAPLAAAEPPRQVFHFDLLNRAYSDLAPGAETVEEGPVAITLQSPRQVLYLRQNRLTLAARPDGQHDAELEVSFLGKGWLVADVAVGGGEPTRLEDELLLPIQGHQLRARVELARVEGGYQVTAHDLPPSVPVRIESRLIAQVLDWCGRLAFLPGTRAACDSLDEALSKVEVPLPARSAPFFLADGDLRPADRERLDAYLTASWNHRLAGLPRLGSGGKN
jgi:hypothetical protein